MTQHNTSLNGKNISYKINGSGLPVMLVHGFGEDDTILRYQIASLKDTFQLIVPQLPGTGNSELQDDTSMESLADALHQVAKDAGIEKFVLIGHSMGGYAALAFAEKYSHHLLALGMFHSSAYADKEEKKEARRKGIEFIKEHGGTAFLKTVTLNLFSDFTKKNKPEILNETLDKIPSFTDESLIAYYTAMMNRKDRTDILSNLKVPVLFILGKYDQSVPFEDGLKQSALPEKSFVTILQETGHMGMLEETQKSNEALNKFLMEIQ